MDAQVRDLKAKLHTAQHEAAKLADTDTQRQIARLKADHADELAQLRALHENALAAAHQQALGGEALAGLMRRVEENAAHVSSLTHKVGDAREVSLGDREAAFKAREEVPPECRVSTRECSECQSVHRVPLC